MDKIERERAAHTSFIILRSTSDLVDIIFKWVLYLPIQILTVFQWNGWNENWKLYFERIYYKHVFYLHFSYTIFTYTHTIFTFMDSRIEWCNRLSFCCCCCCFAWINENFSLFPVTHPQTVFFLHWFSLINRRKT